MEGLNRNISIQVSITLKAFENLNLTQTRLCEAVCSIRDTADSKTLDFGLYYKSLCYITQVLESVIDTNKKFYNIIQDSPLQELQQGMVQALIFDSPNPFQGRQNNITQINDETVNNNSNTTVVARSLDYNLDFTGKLYDNKVVIINDKANSNLFADNSETLPYIENLDNSDPDIENLDNSLPTGGNIDHSLPDDEHVDNSLPTGGNIDHSLPDDENVDNSLPMVEDLNYLLPSKENDDIDNSSPGGENSLPDSENVNNTPSNGGNIDNSPIDGENVDNSLPNGENMSHLLLDSGHIEKSLLNDEKIDNHLPNAEINKTDEEENRLIIIKSKVPSIGDKFTIVHVESLSEFYVCVCDEYSQASVEMNDNIQSVYNIHPSTEKSKSEVKEEIGSYCIAYSSSWNRWFRAKVLDWIEVISASFVHILDVDTGQETFLSYKNIFPMQREFSEIPARAIKCGLLKSINWSEESIDNFKSWTGVVLGQSKILMVTEVQYECESDTVLLDFCDIYSTDGRTIISDLM